MGLRGEPQYPFPVSSDGESLRALRAPVNRAGLAAGAESLTMRGPFHCSLIQEFSMPAPTPSAFVSAALEAAAAAAEIIRSRYQGAFDVQIKPDDSPVTEVDIACEHAIKDVLARAFPEHGFYGEELGRESADADYVWLLGDALRVEPGMLARILDFLDRQDMVFVRAHAEDARMIPAATGEDALALTRELLWHQTLTGATIYSRSVCDWVRTHREDMTLKQNFPQVSVILGFLSAHDARVGWFGEPALRSLPKESYWMSRAITTFVDDWVALVLAFPEVIPPAARAQVIRSHSANTRLFGVGLLHRLKRSGELTWQDLRKPHFFDAMHLNRAAILAVMLMPAGISRLADRVAKRFGAGRS